VGRPIFTGNPGRSSDENVVCSWGNCNATTNSLPICWAHAREAHAVVQATFGAMMDFALKRGGKVDVAKPGFVYFLRFSDRVKIGFSTDPRTRISQLPHDEVLAIFPGTRLNERQLHAAFGDLRLTGEWFTLDDRILDFVTDVKTTAQAS